eukprot:CAMPEP_0203644660 /NCGR_PEP_ID=MMETSP0088-20131115/10045_1 /ASSEMBLY_ACC=CAM_ASM_001087 /TAXON_ID=426623 /ORGANISM="Chaetoceros affinis, Strain CCMP159" /LENGTH=253 /DNA_ID=CAMNT_0050501241 /DNA_START=1 /DNA_END=762 /DNA_ORIENTATION=-
MTPYIFILSLLVVTLGLGLVTSFTPSSSPGRSTNKAKISTKPTIDRQDFISSIITIGIATTTTITSIPQPAQARGRATLEYALDRYYPRIEAGGTFYATDLRTAIEKNDWGAIKAATAEPPPRTKADKAKADGGISERAAQAGGFSNARVISAAELWAASFSDNSISAKTKKMKEQTEVLREVVDGMNAAAKLALGEEKPNGGFFGFGAKAPSQLELAKEVRELYMKGGNAWNQYVFLSNDDLPVQLKRLPYL